MNLTGQAYLTSGYDGAPFGLLVRTHAKAGPFDLGFVNVRSRIDVNEETAAVTVTTDAGPHHEPGGRAEELPTIFKGVPVQLKALNVEVNRPEFQFNPTNCEPLSIGASLSGQRRREPEHLDPVPGGELPEPPVRAEVHGIGGRPRQQSPRHGLPSSRSNPPGSAPRGSGKCS